MLFHFGDDGGTGFFPKVHGCQHLSGFDQQSCHALPLDIELAGKVLWTFAVPANLFLLHRIPESFRSAFADMALAEQLGKRMFPLNCCDTLSRMGKALCKRLGKQGAELGG